MEQEFEAFSAFIRSTSNTDARVIMFRAWEFQKMLRARITPDDYVDAAMFSMFDSVIALARVLSENGPVLKFTIAKRRYHAHEALLALQDEARRQTDEDAAA